MKGVVAPVRLPEPAVVSDREARRGPALVVDAVGRISPEEGGLLAPHEALKAACVGRVAAQEPMLAERVEVSLPRRGLGR